MAQAKIYECPSCQGNFTTVQVKRNGHKCPSCSIPLKHEIDKTGGKMVHLWLIDESAKLTIEVPAEREEAKFEKISNLGVVPKVYRRIAPGRASDPLYRVVHMNRYGPTHLRCPACGNYLHTTNFISGSKQEALCRSKNSIDNETWEKCKTRTEFWFFREGEVFDAYND